MVVTQKFCTVDPMLVEPKYIWEAIDFFQLVYIFSCLFPILQKLPPVKSILALTTWGSKNMHHFRATAFYFCIFSKRTPGKILPQCNQVTQTPNFSIVQVHVRFLQCSNHCVCNSYFLPSVPLLPLEQLLPPLRPSFGVHHNSWPR